MRDILLSILSFKSAVYASLYVAVSLLAGPSNAQTAERPPSHCIALAQSAPGLEYVQKASWAAPLPEQTVRIHYIAHASFLIRAQSGLNMVTDYTGFIGNVDMIPDVVTMNKAHETHWTANPDPAIAHVLPGWSPEFGVPIEHHVELPDVLIRNVSTDIRSRWGEGGEPNANSIFIFEIGGLCIGHLGHLHHEPSPEQYAAIGRLDVVMAAVDGGMTVDLPTMMNIVGRLKSSIVIPMHWWGDGTLNTFLAGMAEEFAIVRLDEPSLDVSLSRLPSRPTIMVLQPAWLRSDG